MVKRVSCLWCLCVVLMAGAMALAAPLAPNDASLQKNLCLWLRMPEVNYDRGTMVWTDVSGKGNDARASVTGFVGPTLAPGANPAVFTRPFSALHFSPTERELLKTTGLNGGAGLTQLTIFSVEKLVTAGGVDQRAVGFGCYQDGNRADAFNLSFDVTVRKNNGNIPGKNQDHPLNAFVIYAARMDPTRINMWFNSTGTLSLAYTATGSSYTVGTDLFYVGDLRYTPAGDFDVAEVVVFNTALTDAQVAGVSEWLQANVGVRAQTRASGSQPASGATDVPRDAVLTWTPVQSAIQRDVYFGTVFADVNNASRTDPKGTLAGKAQTETTFDPAGLLAYGQTYYWRVDEVNKVPDNTIFKGEVWSFTVEPYAYPVKPVTATASSSQPGMGPEKTVDGSGLTAGLHGTESTTMWLSTGTGPNWIQYEFDKIYKLHELTVWNSNQLIEPFVGFGARKVVVEHSTDGTGWKPVGNVPEFAKATGMPGYAANTTVSFGGIEAKYVKLTVLSSWSGLGTSGLSEVRFSAVPVQARAPQPASAATGVKVEAVLDWRPGRAVASHKVFFGTDSAAVTNGTVAPKTVADHGYAPGPLNFGTVYYWRVDEVNAVTYPGEVWSFTTQEYAVVEDFESYTDKAGGSVFDIWIDGLADNYKSSGSTVGLGQAVNGTFCETTIVRGGRQSMPFEYNNVKTPFYSEAERTFDAPQNWTTNGVDTLSLYFRGYPVAFADQGNSAYTVSGGGTDIGGNADQFRFVYKPLSGDGSITARVESQTNTHTAARAGVMIRETLDAGSRHVTLAVTPASSVTFLSRATNNTATTTATVAGGLKAPYWVRITRTGNVFKAECSPDGKTWTQAGTDQTIVMGSSVYFGLAVTSHVVVQIGTAEFSNVATTGTVTGPWQVLALGAIQRSNDPASLYLVIEDKAGKKKTVVNANPTATTAAAWTEWRIPLSDFSAGGVNLAAVKKITLGVGDRANPKAGAAGLLYFDDIGYGHPVK